jgi:hypothetical protein
MKLNQIEIMSGRLQDVQRATMMLIKKRPPLCGPDNSAHIAEGIAAIAMRQGA